MYILHANHEVRYMKPPPITSKLQDMYVVNHHPVCGGGGFHGGGGGCFAVL